MGILRGALERLEFAVGRFGDQALAEVFPVLAEAARTIGEDIVRKFGGADADEPRDHRLLVRRRRPMLPVQKVQEPDRFDIVLRTALPGRRQGPPDVEGEVERRYRQRGCGETARGRGQERRLPTVAGDGLAGGGNDLVEVEAELESQRGCTVSHGGASFSGGSAGTARQPGS